MKSDFITIALALAAIAVLLSGCAQQASSQPANNLPAGELTAPSKDIGPGLPRE